MKFYLTELLCFNSCCSSFTFLNQFLLKIYIITSVNLINDFKNGHRTDFNDSEKNIES